MIINHLRLNVKKSRAEPLLTFMLDSDPALAVSPASENAWSFFCVILVYRQHPPFLNSIIASPVLVGRLGRFQEPPNELPTVSIRRLLEDFASSSIALRCWWATCSSLGKEDRSKIRLSGSVERRRNASSF